MSIFCNLPRDRRAALHAACAAALKPGGLVVIECFAPGQAELRGKRAAGLRGRRSNLAPALRADSAEAEEKEEA